MNLINLLIVFILLCFAAAVLWWAMGKAPLVSPFKEWVMFALALIFVLVLVGMIFGGVPVPHLYGGRG